MTAAKGRVGEEERSTVKKAASTSLAGAQSRVAISTPPVAVKAPRPVTSGGDAMSHPSGPARRNGMVTAGGDGHEPGGGLLVAEGVEGIRHGQVLRGEPIGGEVVVGTGRNADLIDESQEIVIARVFVLGTPNP